MNCWRKIADKFDMSPEEAEKKFKNIRIAYGRYLKKVKEIPSGSGRDAVPVPKEFLNLDWLAGFISTRPCVSNFFFLGDHSDHMELTQSLGSPGSLNKFFSDPGDPSDYMETGLYVTLERNFTT